MSPKSRVCESEEVVGVRDRCRRSRKGRRDYMHTHSLLVCLIERGTYALRLSIYLTRCVTMPVSDLWKEEDRAVISADLRANDF